MKPQHLKRIAVLLGVAVALYLLPRLLGDGGDRGTVQVEEGFAFELADEPVRVDVIDLAAKDTTRLERAGEAWTVNGHPADSAKIRDLLGVLGDLRSDALVARNPGNHHSLGVSADTGRLVEVYTEAGGPIGFHLGKRDIAAGGYYVRAPGTPQVFRLESPAGGYLSRERDGWRDRVIAHVDTAGIREIVVRRDSGESVLRRMEGSWQVDGTPADTVAVQALVRMLPQLSATGFPSDEEAAAADFSSPDAELDVFAEDDGDVTGRRLVLSLRFVKEAAGDWLVKRADESEVYRLTSFAGDRLVPGPEDLRAEDAPDA